MKDTNEANKGFFTGEELLKRKVTEMPCLAGNIFPLVGLCGVAGSSDTGKSSFLRQFAISVSTGGKEFLGFQLKPTHNRSIYVSTEDDDFAMSFLLNKANINRKLPLLAYENLQFIFDTHELDKRLDKMLTERPVDLIVIDAFTDLYGKSMNDTNQVRTFLNVYSQLAQKHRCLIIFLHHTGKRTDDNSPSKHNLLGSQGFEAKMRMVIELRKDGSDEDIRHMCIVKGNYLSREYKTQSYKLLFDDNLNFNNTNERVDFEKLTKIDAEKSSIKETAKYMCEKGSSQEEIARTLGISQSTVSRYLKS